MLLRFTQLAPHWLTHPYWRHDVGLGTPSIPFKVDPSNVDHLVAAVVPAYAAICTLTLP
jgi:hypothetical protein